MERILVTENISLDYIKKTNSYILTLFDEHDNMVQEIELNAYQLRDLQYNLNDVEIDIEASEMNVDDEDNF